MYAEKTTIGEVLYSLGLDKIPIDRTIYFDGVRNWYKSKGYSTYDDYVNFYVKDYITVLKNVDTVSRYIYDPWADNYVYDSSYKITKPL